MRGPLHLVSACLLVATAAIGCSGSRPAGSSEGGDAGPVELLNVSYDPTRELYRDINQAFAKSLQPDAWHGRSTIKQSHAASGSQARAVIDGLDADVVTLAVWPDVEAVAKSGLVRSDWQHRYDNQSVPYHSVVVFVVRKGNPKGIKDWPDLVKGRRVDHHAQPEDLRQRQVQLPRRLGGGARRRRRARRTPEGSWPICTAARPCSTPAPARPRRRSRRRGIGDVHLTFESEAHLEVDEADGELEIIYPKRSIRVDPPGGRRRHERRPQGHAACRRGLPRLPLLARRSGDHRQASLPALGRQIRRRRRPGEAWPAVDTFDVDARGRLGRRNEEVLRRRGRVRRHLPARRSMTRRAASRCTHTHDRRTITHDRLRRTRAAVPISTSQPRVEGRRRGPAVVGPRCCRDSARALRSPSLVVICAGGVPAGGARAAGGVARPRRLPRRGVDAPCPGRLRGFARGLRDRGDRGSSLLGLLVAWVLARIEFPGRRLLDALVDVPLALPTAVAGLVYSALYVPNGWLGQYLVPLGHPGGLFLPRHRARARVREPAVRGPRGAAGDREPRPRHRGGGPDPRSLAGADVPPGRAAGASCPPSSRASRCPSPGPSASTARSSSSRATCRSRPRSPRC